MSKITPFLWFDDNAEEAINFYVSLFPDSKIKSIKHYEDGPTKGQVLAATFELAGLNYMAMDAGPHFTFNEAISMYVSCKDQAEVDHYWDALTKDGGEESQCGWLKDKYGMSWQIIPEQLIEAVTNEDPAKSQAAFTAMLKMKKIIVADIEAAVAQA